MSEERKRILQMLAEGNITADEAERLLAALGEQPKAAGAVTGEVRAAKKPKFLHVKVQADEGSGRRQKNVDIKVPIILLKAGMKLGSILPDDARSEINTKLSDHGINFDLNDLDSEKIDILVQALSESSIDIDADNAQVKIFCA